MTKGSFTWTFHGSCAKGLVASLLLALALLSWSGGKAFAETITFRSGEHATFSRLVLDIPRAAEWQISPAPDGYVLTMDPRHRFDTSRAFDRIPRTRLAELRHGDVPGQLGLVLDCDCHVTAFLFRPDKLVIDIVDGPGPDAGTAEQETARPQADRIGPVAGTGVSLLPLGMPTTPLGSADRASAAGSDPVNDARLFDSSLLDQSAREDSDVGSEEAARITELETTLLESLARAGTQGILDFRHERPASEPPDLPPEPLVPADPVAQDPSVSDLSPGLRIETALDQFRNSASPRLATEEGEACLPDELLDLAAWGDDRPFGVQIGERQAQIIDAAGSLSDEGVLQLARAYLYFGFGEEALSALALSEGSSVERDVLIAIARVLDGREGGSHAVFAGQRGCTGIVALWAALERGNLAGTSESERTAMQRAQQQLPLPIRAQIGVRLSELFLGVSDPAAAAQILDETGSKDTSGALRANLLEAEIARQTEGNAAAIDRLARLAAGDPRMEPLALAELTDLYIAEGQTVPEATIELVATLRHEHRGSEAEAILALAQIRALLFADRFDEALSLRRQELGGLDAETLSSIDRETFVAAASRLDEDSFLPLVFGLDPADLPAEAAAAIKARLLSLGFAEEALAFEAGAPFKEEPAPEPEVMRTEVDPSADTAAFDRSTPDEILPNLPEEGPQSAAVLLPDARLSELAAEPVPDLSALEATLSEWEPQASSTLDGLVSPSPLAERRSLLGEAEATRLRAESLLRQSPFEGEATFSQ